jgi:IS605 OrfB family transposase
MTTRAIGKAADCFKTNAKVCPTFRPLGAIIYDDRILSFKGLDKVSIWTFPAGRILIPIVYGEYQKSRLSKLKGQTFLTFKNSVFYLYCIIDCPEPPAISPDDFLGVDMGICNIAADSDGTVYSGEGVRAARAKVDFLRAKLQSKGTKSAKRLLKKISGKGKLFASHTNHVISKRIVSTAERTGRGVAIEDLSGIRRRATAMRKDTRNTFHSWCFNQLATYIKYKSAAAGVEVKVVDPKGTSQKCSCCGHTDKSNRKTRDKFSCLRCQHSEHADINAAKNIRKADAIRPDAARRASSSSVAAILRKK